MRRKTAIELGADFIKKAELLHGSLYGYFLVCYTNSKTKVEIYCNECRKSFWQTPNSHLMGKGCEVCGYKKTRQKTLSNTLEFITKAEKVHGDLYGYELVDYKGSKIKINIRCKFHDIIFKQTPNRHLMGDGCYLCGDLATCEGITLTSDEFIERAQLIHGNLYGYELVDYKGNKIPVTLICHTHGEFKQTPNCHLNGCGCQKCSYNVSKPETEFLEYLKVPLRNVKLKEWKAKPVDGLDGNTIYEFLGDYWHGNPVKFNPSGLHPRIKKTYGELYTKTFVNLNRMKSYGYTVKYIWENDWKRFKRGVDKEPKIITL